MKKSKSKSTPEFALQTGLGGNGDQVAALQGLNRRGNTKEQRKKAPAIGPKNTSPLKKGVAIDAFQKKLSSVLPSSSSSTSFTPIITKTISPKIEGGAKSKVFQASKNKLGRSKENLQRQCIENSPNDKARNSKEKNVASPAICVVDSKSFPGKGKGKEREKSPEENGIQDTIFYPHQLNENKLSIFHLPTTTSKTPSTSSPPKTAQLLSKSAPKGQSQSKKHHSPTLTTSLTISLPLPLTFQSPLLVPVAPKLLKRFYEALILLTVFGSNRGSRILEEEIPTDSLDDETLEIDISISVLDVNKKHEMDEISRTKLRRSFTRHLAYLCDYEKGGDSTTAIALQQIEGAIVYHVAWNKISRPENGVEFLRKVLGLLGCAGCDVIRDSEEKRKEIVDKIFDLSVKYAEKRISSYASFLARDIRFLLGEWKMDGVDNQDEGRSFHMH